MQGWYGAGAKPRSVWLVAVARRSAHRGDVRITRRSRHPGVRREVGRRVDIHKGGVRRMTATGKVLKVALRREPGIPAGVTPRMFIVCAFDDVEITVPPRTDVTCPSCAATYHGR